MEDYNPGFKSEHVYRLTPSDRIEVIEILTDAFGMQSEQGRSHFGFFIDSPVPKNYVIVRTEEGKMAAVLCLLDKACLFCGIPVEVTGLSYMGIATGFRDFSIRDLLVKGLFESISGNDRLLLGFARKKMDGFWYRFGFLGFTNFGRLSVELRHLPALDTSLQFESCSPRDLPEIQNLYEGAYRGQPFLLKRTSADWATFFDRIKRLSLTLNAIKDAQQNMVGYVLLDRELFIEELAVLPDRWPQFASLIGRFFKTAQPTRTHAEFGIGITHPFSVYICNNYSYTFNTRFAWNGGHIMRIASLQGFLQKMLPVLTTRLANALVSDFTVTVSDVMFVFRDGRLSFKLVKPKADLSLAQLLHWQKMLFGTSDVSMLMFERPLPEPDISLLRILFPVLNSQVPLIDQF